jgi:hypothetical protein
LTTDFTDATDMKSLYPCHPCDPWLSIEGLGVVSNGPGDSLGALSIFN